MCDLKGIQLQSIANGSEWLPETAYKGLGEPLTRIGIGFTSPVKDRQEFTHHKHI